MVPQNLGPMKLKTLVEYIKYRVRGSSAPDAESFDFVKSGMLVFDIGANRGNYTKVFLSKGARVIAVEPQEACVAFLKLRYTFAKNVIIEECGAGAETGTQTFFISNADSISSMNKSWIDKVKASDRFTQWNVEWKKPIHVNITTLDNLIAKHGKPNYVKIDVEGFETEVLKGLTAPIEMVSFEYTLPEMKDEAIECINYLSSLGGYKFSTQLQSQDEYVDKNSILSQINLICESGDLSNGDIFAKLES